MYRYEKEIADFRDAYYRKNKRRFTALFALDTNRVMHVTERFFMFFMSLIIFKLAYGQNLKV